MKSRPLTGRGFGDSFATDSSPESILVRLYGSAPPGRRGPAMNVGTTCMGEVSERGSPD